MESNRQYGDPLRQIVKLEYDQIIPKRWSYMVPKASVFSSARQLHLSINLFTVLTHTYTRAT